MIPFFLSLSPDVDVPHPDEKSIITYVSSLYDVMPRVPDVQDGVKANVSPPLLQISVKMTQMVILILGIVDLRLDLCVSVLQELELRWQEYYELVTMLLQWIRHHILVFEERKFPTSYEEIEVFGPEPRREEGRLFQLT